MSALMVLPILVPFVTAAVTLALRSRRETQYGVGLVGIVLHLLVCMGLVRAVLTHGIVSAAMGNWPAPFGITLVADHLSAVMVMVTAVLSTAVVIYSRAEVGGERSHGSSMPLIHILVGGICGAFLTGDLFNLYVWFEVMLMASFGLLALGSGRQQLAGSVPYVAINLFSTLLFITGLGLLYGMAGTLNMADLHVKLLSLENKGPLTAVACLFMVAFGIKSGLFPLFFWLPASYHTPPVAISALFAGLLTKVGVYALMRTFTLIFVFDVTYTHSLLLLLAGFTMITGVLGAAYQSEFRKILSFHIISQVGYMVMGLALFTPLALAGTVFYLVHHMIVKANLFLVSGMVRSMGHGFELGQLGGLYRSSGLVCVLFLIPAFALAGFPPLSGFWAKMILMKAGLETGDYLIVAVAAVVGLLTIYSMTKIWSEAFWKAAPENPAPAVKRPALWFVMPSAALCGLTVAIGLAAAPLFDISLIAAHELLDPTGYVTAVLGER